MLMQNVSFPDDASPLARAEWIEIEDAVKSRCVNHSLRSRERSGLKYLFLVKGCWHILSPLARAEWIEIHQSNQ